MNEIMEKAERSFLRVECIDGKRTIEGHGNAAILADSAAQALGYILEESPGLMPYARKAISKAFKNAKKKTPLWERFLTRALEMTIGCLAIWGALNLGTQLLGVIMKALGL